MSLYACRLIEGSQSPVSSMSSMTLRMMCSCFCATAVGSLGRSSVGCSRSRKSPYSLRILVTRSVAASVARPRHQPAWQPEPIRATHGPPHTLMGALAHTVGLMDVQLHCMASPQPVWARRALSHTPDEQGTSMRTCQVLCNPGAGGAGRRVGLRRGGHLEQLQQHGVCALHHIARQLVPHAP